jgi:hypothetical protein
VPENENERMKTVTLFPRGSQTGPRFFKEDALLLRNLNVSGNEAENHALIMGALLPQIEP